MAKPIDIPDNDRFNDLTYGLVIDTNDPHQMGRVRAACNLFGENDKTAVGDVPWATPITPLAGTSQSLPRGRDGDKTIGPVAYGMFNVPKIGSHVVLTCIEGDPAQRVYLGCVHDQLLTHTLPHGRYSYDKTNENFKGDEPYGPFSSSEEPIAPLFDTQTEAFIQQTSPTGQTPPGPRKSFEYRTRGADYGVSGVHNEYIIKKRTFYTGTSDAVRQKHTEADGNEINYTFGYNNSKLHEGFSSQYTKENVYDSQTYSWTTPGFHSISMSDTQENCRVRIRSTQGHQIIMDDTNERIYISTAAGSTWIEMDEKGNIDIYGERNISVHAEKDINFTAGDTFRVKAKNGIHLISEDEVRIHAKGENAGSLHIKSNTTTEIHSVDDFSISAPNLFLTANDNIDIKATSGILSLEGGADVNLLSGAGLNLEAGADANLLASGTILQTASSIHLNGPAAGSASPAFPSDELNTLEAFWTDRVPEHEPWARMMTKASITDLDIGNTHANAGEYPYDDANVGRKERGDDLGRNPKWHR